MLQTGNKKLKRNISKQELDKFDRLSQDWWDRNGSMKSLHDINPLRVAYIKYQVSLKGKKILDLGCGGGILSESIVRERAVTTGIDASKEMIALAGRHAQKKGLDIRYIKTNIEVLNTIITDKFDVILCMELIEHVPDYKSVIRACKKLLNTNGTIIFATINRNWVSFFLAIICAEYIMGLLPKGTHTYNAFIKPEELSSACAEVGLVKTDITGFSYNPISRKYYFCKNAWVNYLACYR